MSAAPAGQIVLLSNDGVQVTVGKFSPSPRCASSSLLKASCKVDMKLNCVTLDRPVAERSMLIKNMLEDLGDSALETPVPIPNVSSLHNLLTCEHFLTFYRSMSQYSRRSSSGVSITKTIPQLLSTMIPILARRPRILRNGTKSSCRLIKRCSLRSFL
jgi:S-phase kinase-associated protein 1